jgi:hypothetical protein
MPNINTKESQLTVKRASIMKVFTKCFIVMLITNIVSITALAQSTPETIIIQKGTTNSMVVRWRTETPTESIIDYSTTLGYLNHRVSDLTSKTEHEIEITGLSANTKYYYRISSLSEVLVPEAEDLYFKTHPIHSPFGY